MSIFSAGFAVLKRLQNAPSVLTSSSSAYLSAAVRGSGAFPTRRFPPPVGGIRDYSGYIVFQNVAQGQVPFAMRLVGFHYDYAFSMAPAFQQLRDYGFQR